MSDSRITARFIENQARRILVAAWWPAAASGRSVLIAPPFAEEMNKSRRMLSETARALAARGLATVLPDLTGTGDSSGEFGQADWEQWRADLLAVAAWSGSQGWPVTALLGVRGGCILGAQAARELPRALERTVFWQAVTDGERLLGQFLRLRVAAVAMAGGNESVAQLRARLSTGEALEVAGYELSPRLATQLAGLRLERDLSSALGTLHWLELARVAAGPLPETSAACVRVAQQAGVPVAVETVAGEPFWSATEIVEIPQLVHLTADLLATQR